MFSEGLCVPRILLAGRSNVTTRPITSVTVTSVDLGAGAGDGDGAGAGFGEGAGFGAGAVLASCPGIMSFWPTKIRWGFSSLFFSAITV